MPHSTPGLLGGIAGPSAESYGEHRRRFGPLPAPGAGFIDVLHASGLRGRGGAAFPAGVKWATVAAARGKRPVVLVNGAEGEPLSRKDRTLLTLRPHLVVDGAMLAAQSVGAHRVVFYVGDEHAAAFGAVRKALAERPAAGSERVALVAAPPGYVSGEETAAVHFVNRGVALPTSTPPRPFERGVDGRATVVNNVETLAHAALIARFGAEWFRSAGGGDAPGTALLTLGGAVCRPGVVEVRGGTTIADALQFGGGLTAEAQAVLVGGYFGTWHLPATLTTVRLDAVSLQRSGHALGCGVVHVLPNGACGVDASARVLGYLARESAQQCGPCVFGLRAIADAAARVAQCRGDTEDLERLQRWAGLIRGRGACRHPDGAAQLLRSALSVFASDFTAHARQRRCAAPPGTLARAS
jgi:NADH:ubiquinone oxidoreductase subunit F (NADH-binding)